AGARVRRLHQKAVLSFAEASLSQESIDLIRFRQLARIRDFLGPDPERLELLRREGNRVRRDAFSDELALKLVKRPTCLFLERCSAVDHHDLRRAHATERERKPERREY